MAVLDEEPEPEVRPGDDPELPQAVGEEELGEQEYLDLLRTSWEHSAVVQFCRLFARALSLRPFSADQLESALLNPDEHNMFLGELLYKLLRRDTREPYTEREAFVWEDLLRRKLDAQWPEAFTAHPMAGKDFYSIDPVSRVSKCVPWAAQQSNITERVVTASVVRR
jgi:hypothetical protein